MYIPHVHTYIYHIYILMYIPYACIRASSHCTGKYIFALVYTYLPLAFMRIDTYIYTRISACVHTCIYMRVHIYLHAYTHDST